jgi:hypothetical protein
LSATVASTVCRGAALKNLFCNKNKKNYVMQGDLKTFGINFFNFPYFGNARMKKEIRGEVLLGLCLTDFFDIQASKVSEQIAAAKSFKELHKLRLFENKSAKLFFVCILKTNLCFWGKIKTEKSVRKLFFERIG